MSTRQKKIALRKQQLEGASPQAARERSKGRSTEIRKLHRLEYYIKRRNQAFPGNVNLAQLPSLTAMINSADSDQQLSAAAQIRKLLSVEGNPPIQPVIDAGLVPRFVQILVGHDYPQLQFEVAWALTNIASGSSAHTHTLISAGAVPVFIQLLGAPSDEVREQAVWALGNIAGDSPQCRDFVLNCGPMNALLQQLTESSKLSMLRNATWTLSNMCRGKPQPREEWVLPALPTLARLLYSTDDEVLTDACWALSYLSDGRNERIQAVIEAGICRRLVELLMHSSYSVVTPALRTVGNLVTGDDMQTQVVINVSVLPCLTVLLRSPKKGIRKEACWALSNITAGSRVQIQAVIDSNCIPSLVQQLAHADFDIKKEAAWALSNATSGGSHEQIRYLAEVGCIASFCELLQCSDARVLLVALEGLENFLKCGKVAVGGQDPVDENRYAAMIEASMGVDRLEALQSHSENEIYSKAVTLLETYFAGNDIVPHSSGEQVTPQMEALSLKDTTGMKKHNATKKKTSSP